MVALVDIAPADEQLFDDLRVTGGSGNLESKVSILKRIVQWSTLFDQLSDLLEITFRSLLQRVSPQIEDELNALGIRAALPSSRLHPFKHRGAEPLLFEMNTIKDLKCCTSL